jgi:hypothetical protein
LEFKRNSLDIFLIYHNEMLIDREVQDKIYH